MKVRDFSKMKYKKTKIVCVQICVWQPLIIVKRCHYTTDTPFLTEKNTSLQKNGFNLNKEASRI